VLSVACPRAEGRARNQSALADLRADRAEAALLGFEAAVAASPGFAMARFNRACALARLGRMEESAEALAILLHEDPVMFLPRIEKDEDLAALRDSPQGPQLRTAAERVLVRYREAVAGGVPVVAWPGVDGSCGSWGGDEGPAAPVRPGIYVQESKRFLATAPPVHRAISALYDPSSGERGTPGV
jgi:hypothetical protein